MNIFSPLSIISDSGSYPWALWKAGKGASFRINRKSEICSCWIGVEIPTKIKQPTLIFSSKTNQVSWHRWCAPGPNLVQKHSYLAEKCSRRTLRMGAIPLNQLPSWCYSTNLADSSHVLCDSFAKAISPRDSTTRWKRWSRLLNFILQSELWFVKRPSLSFHTVVPCTWTNTRASIRHYMCTIFWPFSQKAMRSNVVLGSTHPTSPSNPYRCHCVVLRIVLQRSMISCLPAFYFFGLPESGQWWPL